MSTHQRPSPHNRNSTHDSTPQSSLLVEGLAKVLPEGYKFTAHHLSTVPTPCDALCYPPAYKIRSETPDVPNATATIAGGRPSKPLKTYCEKQFLSVSVDSGKKDTTTGLSEPVLVLGLEIYIYSTAFSTTIFVAKADSTGYLSLLNLPADTPSPIREVTAAFVAYLITCRRRLSKQLVVNLFARAQSQYLFPGSVKNAGKHVLNDRGLIKWWCRVLNPLLEETTGLHRMRKAWDRIHGFLIIPGLDDHETRAFMPRTPEAPKNWTLGDPLKQISPYTQDPATYSYDIPPRCLIPTYPDDPKARFVTELEESTSLKAKISGGWRSPRTLEQFWEMMAYRQECSSGRMTGFVWIVFKPTSGSEAVRPKEFVHEGSMVPTPDASFSASTDKAQRLSTPTGIANTQDPILTPNPTPSKTTKVTPTKPKPQKRAKRGLKGRIISRKPQIKTHRRTHYPKLTETRHYYWPEAGRGQVVLDDSGYKRAVELLLNLDFANLEMAIASTVRWTNEVNAGEDWALEIAGQRETAHLTTSGSGAGTVNDLSRLVKRKRPAESGNTTEVQSFASAAPVNMLGGGLIRKKPK